MESSGLQAPLSAGRWVRRPIIHDSDSFLRRITAIGRSIVLIGDAAFVARPHTAMGASKAAGDVMALSASLARAGDLATALQRYEADRIEVGRDIAAHGRELGACAL